MLPKLLAGLSLVIGMCLLMHTLFQGDATGNPEAPQGETHPSRQTPRRGRTASLLLGSLLLAYGLAEVMLRSIG